MLNKTFCSPSNGKTCLSCTLSLLVTEMTLGPQMCEASPLSGRGVSKSFHFLEVVLTGEILTEHETNVGTREDGKGGSLPTKGFDNTTNVLGSPTSMIYARSFIMKRIVNCNKVKRN